MKILTYILVVYLLGGADNQIVTTDIHLHECVSIVKHTLKMPNRIMAQCYRVASDSRSRIKVERFFIDKSKDTDTDNWVSFDNIDISGNK